MTKHIGENINILKVREQQQQKRTKWEKTVHAQIKRA